MADDEIKVKKDRDPIMMVCFVVFILTVCAISGATIYNNYVKADNTAASMGSTVSVDYTGAFYNYSGESNAVVFDTSQWSVANDSNILKSNDFTLRTQSSYTPLSFTVGGTTVLTGFGNAVVGHKVGDTIQVMIPAGQGYTAASTSTTVNTATTMTMPATEVLTASQFNTLYGFTLKGFTTIDKTVYGWPGTASFNSANNTVTMTYTPAAGTSYTAVDNDFGTVAMKVSTVSGNSISYTYVVSKYVPVGPESNGSVPIKMIMVDFGTAKFYITSVTANNGVVTSFVSQTVSERFNQDLYFTIKIVSIS